MLRLETTARPDWREKLEELGFSGHSYDDGSPYWGEGSYYSCSQAQIDALVDIGVELFSHFESSVSECLSEDRLSEFGIPAEASRMIEASFERRDPSLLCRLDFSFDAEGQARLIAIRPDSPLGLLESSEVQWQWKEELFPEADQYNQIYEMIIKSVREMQLPSGVLHFVADPRHDDEWGQAEYLSELATEIGFEAQLFPIKELAWDRQEERLLSPDNEVIKRLFKVYPWELLLQEKHGPRVATDAALIVEPAWSLPLTSKAALALLWERLPEHPALIETHFSGTEGFEELPCFTRQRKPSGGLIFPPGISVYREKIRFQQWENWQPTAQLWMVAGVPSGIGFAERKIGTDRFQFLPHIIEED